MRQLVLNIPDNKYPFIIELMKNFDFINFEEDINTEPTKDEIKNNILNGLQELKLIEEGKLKTRSAREFLNEIHG